MGGILGQISFSFDSGLVPEPIKVKVATTFTSVRKPAPFYLLKLSNKQPVSNVSASGLQLIAGPGMQSLTFNASHGAGTKLMNTITFYDRYQDRTCTEKVYGDKYLRWTYETIGGKLALAAAVKRAWFSRWYGWRMNQPRSREKIAPFIEQYELDASEFIRSPDEFEHFNAFFARQLRPEARPVDPDPSVIVFPADGRHLCVPDISQSNGLFVKGEMFDLKTLLADPDLAQQYEQGSLVLSRLCPVDYHRFHFPVSGCIRETRLINGPLYSVNPIALCQNIQILATNKRTITVLETSDVGRVLLLEIGATCVGSICQTFQPGDDVSKGDEKGYFQFGGSSTITVFEPGRVEFDDDLLTNSARHTELYARFGDHMGRIV